MKRFLLSCCVLALTGTVVFAQASKTNPAKSTSTTKSNAAIVNNFTGKVNGFEAGLSRGNDAAVKQNFEDLKMLMSKDLASLKPLIANAPNQAEKTKWTNILNKKQDIYGAIMVAASDMKGNGSLMVKKYKEYAGTL